jgi:hypothetical protein
LNNHFSVGSTVFYVDGTKDVVKKIYKNGTFCLENSSSRFKQNDEETAVTTGAGFGVRRSQLKIYAETLRTSAILIRFQALFEAREVLGDEIERLKDLLYGTSREMGGATLTNSDLKDSNYLMILEADRIKKRSML